MKFFGIIVAGLFAACSVFAQDHQGALERVVLNQSTHSSERVQVPDTIRVYFVGDHVRAKNDKSSIKTMDFDFRARRVTLWVNMADRCNANGIPISWTQNGEVVTIRDTVSADDNLQCRFEATLDIGKRTGRYGVGGDPKSLRPGDIVVNN